MPAPRPCAGMRLETMERGVSAVHCCSSLFGSCRISDLVFASSRMIFSGPTPNSDDACARINNALRANVSPFCKDAKHYLLARAAAHQILHYVQPAPVRRQVLTQFDIQLLEFALVVIERRVPQLLVLLLHHIAGFNNKVDSSYL